MKSSRIISSFGAAIAVLSILFLPVIGCQDMNLTGLDLINEDQLGEDIRYLIIAAIIFGVLVIIIKNAVASAISALGGGLSLLGAYMIAFDQNELFDLRIGSFIAMIGFTVAALLNFFSPNQNVEEKKQEEILDE